MKNNLNEFIILEQEEGFKELEVADDEEEEGTKRGISILNKSLLSARKRLELEAQKISVKAKVNLYSQNIEGLSSKLAWPKKAWPLLDMDRANQ